MTTYKCKRCNKTSSYRSALICSRCSFHSTSTHSSTHEQNNADIALVDDTTSVSSHSSSSNSSYDGDGGSSSDR